MGLRHLLVAKFKEGVAMDEIYKGLEKMAAQVEDIKSFEWGRDMETKKTSRQGFPHAFLMTFGSSEGFNAYLKHPARVEFAATFRAAVEKYLVLDFSPVSIK